MNSGKIDGSSSVITGDVEMKTNENTKEQVSDKAEEETVQHLDWRDYAAKAVKYSATSFPIYEWKGIDFKLHGFVVAMIAVDVIQNLWSFKPHQWAPYALFRNFVLFSAVILSCIVRIKFFGPEQLKAYNQQQRDQNEAEEDEEKSEIEVTDDGEGNDNEDNIEFKSVIVSYLGGFIALKKMSKTTSKRIFYFGFPFIYYAALALICLIMGLSKEGKGLALKEEDDDGPTARNFWFWLRNAFAYCMLMSLLPVPGFDGAALLTIYLKKKNWNKIMITLTLVFISAIVIVICGFKALVPPFDLIALYIAAFCGIKLLQYAFNPKDENMKVLRTMAKTTKKLTESDLV